MPPRCLWASRDKNKDIPLAFYLVFFINYPPFNFATCCAVLSFNYIFLAWMAPVHILSILFNIFMAGVQLSFPRLTAFRAGRRQSVEPSSLFAGLNRRDHGGGRCRPVMCLPVQIMQHWQLGLQWRYG